MARADNESADKTIERLRILLAQVKDGKSSKRTSRGALLGNCQPIEVLGVQDNVERAMCNEGQLTKLDTSVPNKDLWKNARQVLIGSTVVSVKYNVPTITALVPPAALYVGTPAVCAGVTALFTAETDVQYEWCSKPSSKGASGAGASTTVAAADVRVISTDPVFTPTTRELGESLFLRVRPSPCSDLVTQVELPEVRVEVPPMDRWNHTRSPVQAPTFRVVTYNVLHDEFCTSSSAKKTIYPFATKDILSLEYRQGRIAQELLAYNGDIICLQECGKKGFHQFFVRVMTQYGFEGSFTNKSGGAQEGCACFWRASRFSLQRKDEFPLNWSTMEGDHQALAADVASHPELKEALENVTSIAAVLVLKDNATSEELVVGNTHLFYHANACHIRLLQAYMLLYKLKSFNGPSGAAVLCGDFNFTHTTGGYKLVTTGRAEAAHHSWAKGEVFHWGCDRMLGLSAAEGAALAIAAKAESHEGKVKPLASNAKHTEGDKDGGRRKSSDGKSDVLTDEATNTVDTGGVGNLDTRRRPPFDPFRGDLQVPLELKDAYAVTDPEMPWTNYTMTFREVIDYVFFTPSRLSVVQTVPIPPECELSENVALPNLKYPSDHIALVADLCYK